MPKVLIYLLLVCIGDIALAFVDRAPAEAYDIYYLSVGNSHYQDTTLDFPSANQVAQEIAQTLQVAGAVDGLTLTSKEGAYVTRDEVLGALNQIASKAKAARNPLVIYYFLGHGGSGKDDRSHVSLLGHYKPSDLSDVTRSSAIVVTQKIEDFLEGQRLPYILLLDNCYYREPVSGLKGVADAVVDQLIDILRTARITDPAIILYAAKRGERIAAVAHPEHEDMASGPLARRLLLLLKATFASQQGLTVANFLQQMNDRAFDPKSVPGQYRERIRNSGSTVLIPAGARFKSPKSER